MFSVHRSKDFILHIDTHEVEIGRQKFKLTPKETGVLELLNERRNTTVTRTEILESVWGLKFANDQGLTQAISRLRSILSKSPHVAIITVPKKGYQLQQKQHVTKQQHNVLSWMRTHSGLLAAMLVGIVICILLLTDQIRIRVSKEKIYKVPVPEAGTGS